MYICINDRKPGEIVEENNYYPFGLKHEGYNILAGNLAYKYQYNGKELQQETGWNDYGARMYMPELGRWGVMDALSEKYNSYSPFNYAINNPVMIIDPDGNDAKTYTDHDAINAFLDYRENMDAGRFSNFKSMSASFSLLDGQGKNPFSHVDFTKFGTPFDDHFNQFGKFLYTDNKSTNNIVIDFQNPITGSLNTAPWLSIQLKDYMFDKDNFFIISNIAKYYAKAAGVNLSNLRNGEFSGSVWNGQKWDGGVTDLKSGTFNTFNAGTYSYRGLVSTVKQDRTINFTVTNGHLNSYLNDKYNLISTLGHEGGKISHLTVNINPIDDSNAAQRNEHLILYKHQINSPIFKKTTPDYQKLILTNYKDVINGATGN